MDPRHESYKEAFLNNLITVINHYLTESIDIVVSDKPIQEEIREICQLIYQYVDVLVDVDGVLSKQNMLSIDTVLFPTIHDPEATIKLNDEKFVKLIQRILLVLNSHAASDGILRNTMRKIIDERLNVK